MGHLDRWPSEQREQRDPVTGARILQLTSLPADHFLLANADSSLTPSGDALLFTSDRGGPDLNLFRLDLLSGEIVQVTGTDRLERDSVTPAANGRQAIARLTGEDGELVAVELETGEWETLAVFPDASLDGCHLSASGEYVVTVVRRGDDVVLTAVHTEGMRTIPILQELLGAAAPRFSPDSRNTVLYSGVQVFRCSGVQAKRQAVRCVEFDGSGDRLLYPTVGAGGDDEGADGVETRSSDAPVLTASWLGTGEAVIVVAGVEAGPIAVVPRPGGRERILCKEPCTWARSDVRGERIVAVTAADGSGVIVLLDALSGEATRLCTGCSGEVQPTFSPDGRALVYADRDEEGHFQLFMVRADEG